MIVLEARYINDDTKVATFEGVTFTYREAHWSATRGAGDAGMRSVTEAPRLDVAGLPPVDHDAGWNFIVFAGVGEEGCEITKTDTLPNGLIRFTLRGA